MFDRNTETNVILMQKCSGPLPKICMWNYVFQLLLSIWKRRIRSVALYHCDQWLTLIVTYIYMAMKYMCIVSINCILNLNNACICTYAHTHIYIYIHFFFLFLVFKLVCPFCFEQQFLSSTSRYENIKHLLDHDYKQWEYYL